MINKTEKQTQTKIGPEALENMKVGKRKKTKRNEEYKDEMSRNLMEQTERKRCQR